MLALEATVLFVVVLALTWLGVRQMIRVSVCANIMDVPNERSSHTRVMPRGGGLPLAVVVLGAAGWIAFRHGGVDTVAWITAMGTAFLIALTGFLDDLRSLDFRLRLLVQLACALAVVSKLGYWNELAIPGTAFKWDWGIGGMLITVVWIVGLTNVYNFMDGIDGIAGAQALTAGLGWAVCGMLLGHDAMLLAGLAVGAGAIAFLWFNWAPARIFMGDVGSAFLGFLFAILPLLWLGDASDSDFLPAQSRLVIAAFLVWPFLTDGAYTFLHRLLKRENVFAAHRSHLYQRLVQTGIPHDCVSRLYGLFGILGIGAAFLWVETTAWWSLAVSGAILLACFVALRQFTLMRERQRDQKGP